MKNFSIIKFISRLGFTLVNLFRYRKQLKQCLIYNQLAQSPQKLNIDFSIKNIEALDLQALSQANIKALILDYDGVLSNHGESQPLPAIMLWLEQAIKIFGGENIFVLSNNPQTERKEFLDAHFNRQIEFVINKPKPYPDSVIYIYQKLYSNSGSISKENILLIDDRIGTGILAAKIVGVSSCLILDPYVNFNKHLIIEFLLTVVRKLERCLIWHLS